MSAKRDNLAVASKKKVPSTIHAGKHNERSSGLTYVLNALTSMRSSKFIINLFRFISSNVFLYVVFAIFIIQALWFASSFYFPMLFDESFHFNVTNAFMDKWTPFLSNESTGIYYLRDLAHESGLLYHFLLSFPLRITQLFTDSLAVQVIVLRYVNVLLAVGGLLLFVKLLRRITLPSYAINLGILAYAVLPISTYVAGTINYDNAIFLLFPLFILACIKAVTANGKTRLTAFLGLVVVGCAASLMKYTFLPMFAAGFLAVIAIYLARGEAFKTLQSMIHNLRSPRQWGWKLSGVIIAFIIVVGMFSGVYLKNVALYGTPSPKCDRSTTLQICMKNATFKRNYEAKQTVDERPTMTLIDYVGFTWLKSMTTGFGYIAANTEKGVVGSAPLPVIYNAIGFGFFMLVILLAAGRMYIPKNTPILIVWVIVAVTVLSLLFYNIRSYYGYHEIFANQARYLIFILPFVFALGILVFNRILKHAQITKSILLIIALLVMTQGGGAISYLIRSDHTWFLNNQAVREVNDKLKTIADALVKS